MKQYILFDLDGTIIDPKIGITSSVAYALNKFDIHVENLDNLCKFIGPPLKDSFIEYYNFSDEAAEKAILYYRERFQEKGIYENFLYENFEDMLISLKKQGKTLLIATSKPAVFAERILEHFNLRQYFDFVGGSNLDGTRANKAEVIFHVLKENSISDLSTAIMVGDRKHDIIGAKKAGLQSVGVLYGYGNYQELETSGADYIVKDVEELSTLLCS
ncbi:MAG: HAD family hydrolase [Clostridium sp.]|nr:HAD family hydrolase [Clostridium culturomicium]MDU4889995.1 HAD family hydrolase [Clostridium sp.]MDU7083702.1 HAD family hydrolase [Clostridium sp.]